MSESIVVNLSSYPEDITVNLTTESSGVTANIVETTLTFLEGAGLYRENVFTEDNTFEQDVTVEGNFTVDGTTIIPHISGNTALSGNLTITGDNNITGNLSVTGSTSTDNITFDQTPELAGGVGVLRWNETDGTLDLGLKGGNVTLQVGQEQIVRVVNKTGADLLESQYKVVRIRLASEGGAQGQRLAVVLAQGDNDPDSVTTLGIVTENITNNQEGFITTSGLVRGINTTGTLQGETWVDGDVLYLSPTIAGGLTKVKPTAPNHTVTVAYVEYAHQNNGKLFVKIDNGYELDELHNVRITNPQDTQVLTYNALSGIWENADSTGGGGGGEYLPLSGGTITGALVVQDGFTSNGDEALFTGINFTVDTTNTVIESTSTVGITAPTINLNATSGVTVSGNLSASGIVTSPDFSLTGTVGGELVASKSVAGWAFTNKTTPQLTIDGSPQAVFFKPDGSQVYVLGSGGATTYRVYAYNVPTPWDVSTVSATPTLSSGLIESSMQGLYFSPDGRYFFTVSSASRILRRFVMPVGSEWNVSTGTLSGTFTFPSASPAMTIIRGITFKPDGTKLYVVEDNTNTVYEYDLPTAWDVTTAVRPAGNPSIVIPDSGSDLSISSDGKRLIIVTNSTNLIFEYTLPTPWSLVGGFLYARMFRSSNTFAFPNGGPNTPENGMTGIYYNDVLNKCFFIGTLGDKVQEIDVTPQPAIVGTRPIILSDRSGSVADRVTMHSLQLNDTTSTSSTGTGALLVNGGVGIGGGIAAGATIAAPSFQVGSTIFWSSATQITGTVNGILRLTTNNLVDFNMLQLGPQGTAYPAIKRNGTGVDIVRSDQTTYGSTPLAGFTDLRANNITAFGKLSSTGPVLFPSYTVTGVPPAAGNTGGMIYVSNEVGGATMAFSNGTNWLRVQDRAIISQTP
jgi:hypothetical protein